MKIIGQRTGLVWPDDVRTLDELCNREREAASVPLPSGNPDTSVEQWIRDTSKAWGVTREVAIELRKTLNGLLGS
jgi:hypothetical protein